MFIISKDIYTFIEMIMIMITYSRWKALLSYHGFIQILFLIGLKDVEEQSHRIVPDRTEQVHDITLGIFM